MSNMNMCSKIFINLLLIVAVIFIPGCGSNDDENNQTTISGTPVSVTHPVIMNLTEDIILNANTVFLKKEVVRATFQGFVEEIYKNIGDEVKSGDILFQLRTKESAASDSSQIKIGERVFSGSIRIKAKTTGILTELNYHNGDFVSDGEQLAIISNPSSVRIKLNVPFEDILKIKIGRNCKIDLPDGEIFNGIIEKSIPSVDQDTQTQIYLIKLHNQKTLPENLNVIVKIPFSSFRNATVIPLISILTDVTQDHFWIMKLLNDTTAVRINIKKGIESDSIVQVLSPPLNTSDRIVTTGSYGLPDTAKVQIVK